MKPTNPGELVTSPEFLSASRPSQKRLRDGWKVRQTLLRSLALSARADVIRSIAPTGMPTHAGRLRAS